LGKDLDEEMPPRYQYIHLSPRWYASASGKRAGTKKSDKKRKHLKTHGKIGFKELSKTVASRWAALEETDSATKQYCIKIAQRELDAYKDQKQEYTASIETQIKGISKFSDTIADINEYTSPSGHIPTNVPTAQPLPASATSSIPNLFNFLSNNGFLPTSAAAGLGVQPVDQFMLMNSPQLVPSARISNNHTAAAGLCAQSADQISSSTNKRRYSDPSQISQPVNQFSSTNRRSMPSVSISNACTTLRHMNQELMSSAFASNPNWTYLSFQPTANSNDDCTGTYSFHPVPDQLLEPLDSFLRQASNGFRDTQMQVHNSTISNGTPQVSGYDDAKQQSHLQGPKSANTERNQRKRSNEDMCNDSIPLPHGNGAEILFSSNDASMLVKAVFDNDED
jgi:hypothetical protein